MDISAIAVQGLQQAYTQLEAAATRIASFGASSPDGADLSTADLAAEVVALNSAQTQVSLNLKTLQTVEQVQKSMIDVLA